MLSMYSGNNLHLKRILPFAVGVVLLFCGPSPTDPGRDGRRLEPALPPGICDPPHTNCDLRAPTWTERQKYTATLQYVSNNPECSAIRHQIQLRSTWSKRWYVWDNLVCAQEDTYVCPGGELGGDYHEEWDEIHHWSATFSEHIIYLAGYVIHEAAHGIGFDEGQAEYMRQICLQW